MLEKQGLLDFHTHSIHSDGSDTPSQLVKRAKNHGVTALALTDHNVVLGLEEFNNACKEYKIFAIPFGIEICVDLPLDILAQEEKNVFDVMFLGKNPKKELLKEYQKILIKYRREKGLSDCLNSLERLGFNIPKLDLEEQIREGIPRIRHDFIYYKGNLKTLIEYVQNIGLEVEESEIMNYPMNFINKYLYSFGRPGYVKSIEGFGVKDAVALSEAMNCKTFIAHPGGEDNPIDDKVLKYFIEQGIHGIEIRSYFNTIEQNKKFENLAKEYGLIKSGGSDYHGDFGPFKIGCYDRSFNQLPKKVLEELLDNLP